MKNREYFISEQRADNMDDAELLAPDWTRQIVEVDGGFMCYENEPDNVWIDGRDR